MKKAIVTVAAASLLAFPVTAQAAPQYNEAQLVRYAFLKTWSEASYEVRQNVCSGYYMMPRRVVNLLSRPTIRKGYADAWTTKRVIRKMLSKKC